MWSWLNIFKMICFHSKMHLPTQVWISCLWDQKSDKSNICDIKCPSIKSRRPVDTIVKVKKWCSNDSPAKEFSMLLSGGGKEELSWPRTLHHKIISRQVAGHEVVWTKRQRYHFWISHHGHEHTSSVHDPPVHRSLMWTEGDPCNTKHLERKETLDNVCHLSFKGRWSPEWKTAEMCSHHRELTRKSWQRKRRMRLPAKLSSGPSASLQKFQEEASRSQLSARKLSDKGELCSVTGLFFFTWCHCCASFYAHPFLSGWHCTSSCWILSWGELKGSQAFWIIVHSRMQTCHPHKVLFLPQ